LVLLDDKGNERIFTLDTNMDEPPPEGIDQEDSARKKKKRLF
jgi:hypothetical protein